MAESKPTNREKVKEIVAGIESGIQALFQSERYAEYLRTMSRFHNYSYNNTLLIHMQRPDATLVAGFQKWKNQFQRHVKKGEKGITILAPTPFKKRIEEMKLDPDTQNPVRDENGNIVTEEKVVEIPMFRPVKVFDVKQTDGKPLPELVKDLTGDVRQYEAFMEALRRASPVPVRFKPLREGLDGVFSQKNQDITIREGMSQVQTVCAAVHEITHAVLHNRRLDQSTAAAGVEGAKPAKGRDEQTEEVEAESVSYAVCQYFGIETGENSLGYIATWSSGKELPELKASLETISKTADFLITTIDRHFAQICKERGVVLEEMERDAPDAGDSALEEQNQAPPQGADEYLYSSEYNPDHVGKEDFRRIRARKLTDPDFTPEQIIFVGSAGMCDKLLTLLSLKELTHEDFVHISTAVVSRYTTKDGADLDAFVGPDDQVYLGRRDHYDNRGHYLNKDSSLLFVSGNPKMFDFLSCKGFDETQSELLEGGYFTPEDYAEFAALQSDVLAQFEEREPLLFAGEPFCFIPLEPSEVNLDISPTQGEALYLVDSTAYLHIQTCDAGYNYTIYDKATMRQLDSGQIDPLNVDEHFSQGGLRPVADAVLISAQNLTGETVVELPPELLETLQENALPDVQVSREDTALDEYPMPDPLSTKEELARDYGYQAGDMLPLSKDRAAELLERDFTVYAIVDGGSAEMVFDRDDLAERPLDMLFAVPAEEWESSPDFKQAVAERMNHQKEREQAFLGHAGDCFAIYQIRDGEGQRNLRYMNMDWLISKGLTPERSNYDLVYTGEMASGQGSSALERLWVKFNDKRPADYLRPSMSVSDIIAVKQDGVVSCHYCDSFGYAKVPDFIKPENYLKAAELSMEDDCNMIDGIINNGPKEPSVADLEAQVKAGKQISLMDLAAAVHRERGKKSVVSQLKEKPARERQKAARKKNLEKER